MLSKSATLLLLGTLAVGCWGQCQHQQRDTLWRNDPFSRGREWGLQPLWRHSQFDDLFSIFDDSWFYQQPFHNIFSVLEDENNRQTQASQLESDEKGDVIRERCYKQRQAKEEQDRMRREEERKQRIAMLNKEEKELVKQRQERAKQFQLEEEAFKKRQEEISKLKNKETSNAEVNGAKQDMQVQMTEKQRLENERRRTVQQNQFQERQKEAEREEEQRRQAALVEERAQLRRQQALVEERRRQEAMRQEQIKQARQHRNAGKKNIVELAKHQVNGYDPDDITVHVTNGKVQIEGKHICHCQENCITKEFARTYALPPRVDTQTIIATMDKDGNIKIHGIPNSSDGSRTSDTLVHVQGLGIPQSTRPSAEQLRKCLSQKGGIKLSKINKNTGKVHVDDYKYDHEVLESKRLKDNDSAVDYDEGLVETVDY